MLKKVLIASLLLIVIVAGLGAFAVYRASDIVRSFKPQIEAKASAALGSRVSLGNLSVSVFPKTEISVDEITILPPSTTQTADQVGTAQETKPRGLTLKNVTVHAALLPLLSRKLEITDLEIASPNITIIRDGSGVYLNGLPRKDAHKTAGEKPASNLPSDTKPEAKTSLDIALQSVTISGATITFEDRISNTQVTLGDGTLKSELSISDAAVNVPTLKFKGTVTTQGGTPASPPETVPLSVVGTAIVVAQSNSDVTFESVVLTLPDTSLTLKGSTSKSGEIAITSGGVNLPKLIPLALPFAQELSVLKGVALGVKDLTGTLRERGEKSEVSTATLTIPGGTLTTHGTFEANTGDAKIAVEGKEIDLSALASGLSPITPLLSEYHTTGRVSLNADVSARTKGNVTYKAKAPIQLTNVEATLPFSGGLSVRSLSGIVDLSASETALAASSKQLGLQIQGEEVKSQFDVGLAEKKITATVGSLAGFGGTTSLQGTVALTGSQPFTSNSKITAVSLDRVLKAFAPKLLEKVTGTITSLTASVSGELKASNIITSLHGPVQLVFSNGAAKGFNVAAEVLKKLNDIPLVQGSLAAYVPAQYQPLLKSDETPIRELKTTVALQGSTIAIQSLNLLSDIFSLESQGSITLLPNEKIDLHLDATISFTKEFSETLAGSIKELRKIFDPSGRLTFPLTFSGSPPSVVVIPNLKKILELGAKTAIKDEAARVLDRALGGKSPGKEGVKKALEGILGF